MRCPTCAAFVEDDATSCTSCGSEIAVGAPPPLPPEFEAPADPGPSGGSDSGSSPSRRPSSASGDPGICDGCQNTFPPMQLSRIHGQRLCDDCADRADRSSSSGSHQVPGSGSGRVPSASGSHKQSVSKGPLVVVGIVAVALIGVAVYFTVIAPGAAAGNGNSTAGVTPTAAPAPQPVVAPPVAPVPTPIKRPEDITIQGTLQPFNRTPNGDVPRIEFKDLVNDKTLIVTGTDRYVAEDLTPGKRYNVSFRGIRSDTGTQEVKYSLDIEFEQVESGG